MAELQQLDFVDVDTALPGPSLVTWMELTDTHNTFMLYWIPDVALLAYYTSFIPSVSDDVVACCHNLLRHTRELGFRFFRYECWEFDLYVFQKPDLARRPVQVPPEDERLWHAAAVLYKFLVVAPEHVAAPPDLPDFKSQSLLAGLVAEVDALGDNASLLLPTTEAQLRLDLAAVAQNDAQMTRILKLSEDFAAVCRASERRISEVRGVLHSQLRQLFILRHPMILRTVGPETAVVCRERKHLRDFFTQASEHVGTFLSTFAGYAIPSVCRHLHSQFMQYLTLTNFTEVHKALIRRDEALMSFSPDALPDARRWKTPEKDPLFSIARQQLAYARRIEIPIEAVHAILTCTDHSRRCSE
jgi:hypothetical protein